MNLKDKAKKLAKKKGGIWDGKVPYEAIDFCLTDAVSIGADVMHLRVHSIDDAEVVLKHRMERTVLFLIGGILAILGGIALVAIVSSARASGQRVRGKAIGGGIALVVVGFGLLIPVLRELLLTIDWKEKICRRVFMLGLKKETTSLADVHSVNIHFGKQIKMEFGSPAGMILPLQARHSSSDDGAALFIRFGLYCAKHLKARVNFHGRLEYDDDEPISPVVLHEMTRIRKGKQEYQKQVAASKAAVAEPVSAEDAAG